MPSPAETLQTVRRTLEPYVRPRHEVSHIRRVLALHLDSCLQDGSALPPLALVSPPGGVQPSPDTRGLQREYLKALEANLRARTEHEALVAETQAGPLDSRDHGASHRGSGLADGRGMAGTESRLITGSSSPAQRPLEEHVCRLQLQKKQDRLRAIEKYLDTLSQQPAASPRVFLNPEDIFRDAPALPEVPRDVVNGIAHMSAPASASSPGASRPLPSLPELIAQIEKQVLRARLLLQREEQLLQIVRARCASRDPPLDAAGPGAKLAALDATRTELINWIESELGKAAPPGGGADDGDGQGGETPPRHVQQGPALADAERMNAHVTGIKQKYAAYVSARTELVQLVEKVHEQQQAPLSIVKPSQDIQATVAVGDVTFSSSARRQQQQQQQQQQPFNYLLPPYLDALLSIARQQKALIAHKAHLNMTVARQLKDNCRVLDRLGEESSLLHRRTAGHQQEDDNDQPLQLDHSLLRRSLSGGAGGLMSTARRALGAPFVVGASKSDSVIGTGGGGDSGSGSNPSLNNLDPTMRVQPWVAAAETAKIATLEAVADRVEQAQVALEGTFASLAEMDRLLGRHQEQQQQEEGGAEGGNDNETGTGGVEGSSLLGEEDIWLREPSPMASSRRQSSRARVAAAAERRKEKERGKEKNKQESVARKDIWDMLDGNLGLLGGDDDDGPETRV